MGLIRKIFGTTEAAEAKPTAGSSTQFVESQTALEKTKSRNAPRRDLVKVVLRETMRKHGIPSDWIECRSLSVLTRHHKPGMHVQLLVRRADHQLLPYVHAFQESFWEQILRLDPTAREWLFSVGWEFYGKAVHGFSDLPGADAWDTGGDTQAMDTDPQPLEAGDTQACPVDEDVASDLQALQALMSAPAELSELPEPRPRKHKTVS
jgi:hypothetical protein